jgi:arsenate reductase
VKNPDQAVEVGFRGSPTILVDGRDLEDREIGDGSLACRVFASGDGVPQPWLLEAALVRAMRPSGCLFLCVANSARSQMAEGIARSLAPGGVRVASAGSEPSIVRPEAVQVLEEIGIDISGQRSKNVSEVDPGWVDVVVTLCADEVCPVFLGKAVRLHWGLPDPAAVVEPDERFESFRAARDELRRRLGVLFDVG